MSFQLIFFPSWAFLLGNLANGYTPLTYENEYGDDYGKEWIYFPDGDGVPYFVNLSAYVEQYNMSRQAQHINISYRLYTSNNTENFTILDDFGKVQNEQMTELHLSKVPLKVITHGWKSSTEKYSIKSIKDAYVEFRNVNVITADWSYTADSIFYNWVANQTVTVGMQIATFLEELNKLYNVSGDQIHLIGHSLGAHAMGIAAHHTNLTIGRITGLDPARPLFEYPSRDDTEKLDRTDAVFVDIIHTCGGLLGIESAMGTADFYPNSGIPPQPGCNSIQKIFEACSHGRSQNYFVESIKNIKAFPASKCESWLDFLKNNCDQYGFMGEGVNTNITGKFYLKTNPNEPFGRSLESFCLIENAGLS